MKQFLTSLGLIAAMILTQAAACNKVKTIRQLEDIADELRIHNLKIAKVTNEAFDAGKIDAKFHKGVLTANAKFSKALDTADRAITAAKVATSRELKGALDYAQRIIDRDMFDAFQAVAESAINIPQEIKDKIEPILASVRLLFATLRGILSDAQIAVGGRENYV